MKTRRWRSWVAPLVLAVVLVIAAAIPVAAAAQGVRARDQAQDGAGLRAVRVTAATQNQVERKVIVRAGDPIVVGPEERVQTVVSIGGDVKIAGTVDESVVVIGGDLLLRATADVGRKMKDPDATVVVVNGKLTRQTGAQVAGKIEVVDIGNLGDVVAWAARNDGWQVFRPIGSFVGWLLCTVVILLLGLLAAAIMPGQIRAVGRQVARRPGGSLGWGALTVLLIVPLSIVLLMITVIGIIPAVGVLIVLPFFTVFVVTSVATFAAERLLGAQLKGNLMGAVAIGSVATSTVVQIPFLGFIILAAMTFIGTGAALIAWNRWRQERRLVREGGSPTTGGPGQGPGGAPQGVPPGAPSAEPQGVPPGVPPAFWYPAGAQSPGTPPQDVRPVDAPQQLAPPPYAQSPYAPPPIAQAPVGTHAYLHPQYGWVVYGPPAEAQTAAQPEVAELGTQVTPPDTQAEVPAAPAHGAETSMIGSEATDPDADAAADDVGAAGMPRDDVE